MTSHCHNCGLEYLVARANAGKTVVCRRCGAQNDGGGGAPPAQSADPAAEARRRAQPLSGAAFTLGERPRAVDARRLDEAYRVAVESKVAAEVAAQREADGGAARLIKALGIVAASIAVLIVGAVLLVNHLRARPAGVEWARYQLAVPQITSDLGTGTGFVIEDRGVLWLVTNFHVIEGARAVDAIFRSPADGSVLFRLPGLAARDFRVHPRFLEVMEIAPDAREFDLAAVSIEAFRPQIERIGVEPLEIAPSADLAVGTRVVALGHVASRAFDLAADGDDEARGVATHSLFDGLISGVRRASGKPTLVQTSANFSDGCSGGPLMLEESLEVAAVATWGERNADGTERAGLKFALAADQVLDIVRAGPSLRAVRESIVAAAAEPTPPAGVVDEARGWSTFAGFLDLLRFLEREGWTVTARGIAATDGARLGSFAHRVVGPGSVEVAVLALPRDRAVDLDIVDVSVGGAAGAAWSGFGSNLAVAHGEVVGALLTIPGSDVAASLLAGSDLSISIGTLFLGEAVDARHLVVVLERATGAQMGPPAPSGAKPPATP
jgi:S1-C subfamily serine protease